MKEFESWLDHKSYSQAEERIAEAAWRQALEWTMKQHCLYYSSHTFKVIEKELEDGSA